MALVLPRVLFASLWPTQTKLSEPSCYSTTIRFSSGSTPRTRTRTSAEVWIVQTLLVGSKVLICTFLCLILWVWYDNMCVSYSCMCVQPIRIIIWLELVLGFIRAHWFPMHLHSKCAFYWIRGGSTLEIRQTLVSSFVWKSLLVC